MALTAWRSSAAKVSMSSRSGFMPMRSPNWPTISTWSTSPLSASTRAVSAYTIGLSRTAPTRAISTGLSASSLAPGRRPTRSRVRRLRLGNTSPARPSTSAASATAPPPSESTATLRPLAQRRLTATQARSTASAGEVASQAPDSSHTARRTRASVASAPVWEATARAEAPVSPAGITTTAVPRSREYSSAPSEVVPVERILEIDDGGLGALVVGQSPDHLAGSEAVLVADAQERRQSDPPVVEL